jgi:hypothetical protein
LRTYVEMATFCNPAFLPFPLLRGRDIDRLQFELFLKIRSESIKRDRASDRRMNQSFIKRQMIGST